MMKRIWIILLAVLVLAVFSATAEDAAVTVAFTDEGLAQEADGVSFHDGVVSIFKPGTYELSGTLTDGQIEVTAAEKGAVVLILNGVTVHNETTAAVYIGKCESRVVISLAEGTENVISDGPAADADPDEEPNGALFSKSDLAIEGSGSLLVTAGRVDGIVSKDTLTIRGGKITVEARRQGIKGKDCVVIEDGVIDITAGKDGIKSTNKKDAALGYISITGGTIHIVCGDEPVQAETRFDIEGAKITTEKVQ